MPIVTSTYRYKLPPRKRKAVALAVPAIVTIDPKTRRAKKGRRQTEGIETAAEAETSPSRFGSAAAPQSTTELPQPANVVRRSAIVTAKKGRRPSVLRSRKAAAEVTKDDPPGRLSQAGKHQPNPVPGRSAIAITTKRAGQGEEITPEKLKRRGDAADAMFREMKRQIAAALKSSGR